MRTTSWVWDSRPGPFLVNRRIGKPGTLPACVSFRWLGIARERQRTDTAFLAYVSTSTDAIVHHNNAIK